MKRTLFCLICLLCVVVFCGCAPKTEYDDKEVIKIETSWFEYMSGFWCELVRTYDFQTGEVIDTWVADAEEVEENVAPYNIERYNNPKTVASFSEKDAKKFLKKEKSLGLYAWEEKYDYPVICDGGRVEKVTIFFSDGTTKTTKIFFYEAPNYDEIKKAFEDYFGVTMYIKLK